MNQDVVEKFVFEHESDLLAALKRIPVYQRISFSDNHLDGNRFRELPLLNKQDVTQGFPFNFVGGRESEFSEKIEKGTWEIIESSGTSSDRIQIIRNANFREIWSPRIREYHNVYANRDSVREALLTTLNCSRAQCNLGVATYEERLFGERLVLNRSRTPALWDDAECERMLAEIERFSPQVLTAHPVYLSLIDQWCETKGIIPPKSDAVFMSYDYATRRSLARAGRWSRSGVFRSYGLTEAFTVAMDCEHGSLHAINEGCLVEILPYGNIPNVGEIVITSLRNDVMPLIRYRTGDLALIDPAQAPCPCGRSGLVIQRLEGRISELTFDSDNQSVTAGSVDAAVSECDGVEFFQLEQRGDRSVALGVVVNERFDERQRQALSGILRRLYRQSNVNVTTLPEMSPTRTGKFKIITRSIGPSA